MNLSIIAEILKQDPEWITEILKYVEQSKNANGDTQWDKIYQRNNDDIAWYTVDPCQVLLDQITDYQPCRILEVGSGFGVNSIALAKLGHQVTAIDISGSVILLSKFLAQKQNVSVNFIEGNFGVDNLDLRDFDLVIDRCVFHADPTNFVPTVKQSLKPGGSWISIVHSGPKTNEWGVIPSMTVEQIVERLEPMFNVASICKNQIAINRAEIPVLVVHSTVA